MSAGAAGGRPLAKTLIKGGLAVVETVQKVVAEAGEQLSDLVGKSRRSASPPKRPLHRG